MSSYKDMPFLNLDYHWKNFWAAGTKDEILVKLRNSWLCLAIQTMIHIPPSCLSPKQFTHFFIFNYYYHKIPLCHLKEHCSHYAQCWPLFSLYCLYYWYSHPTIFRHHSKSVLSFRSSLMDNYSNFPLAIFNMPFTLSLFERQKMWWTMFAPITWPWELTHDLIDPTRARDHGNACDPEYGTWSITWLITYIQYLYMLGMWLTTWL